MAGQTKAKLTERQKTAIAEAMIDIIAKYDMFYDVNIHVNNAVMKSDYTGKDPNAQVKITPKGHTPYTFLPNMPYTDQYGNPELITCTFEGPLYEALNYCCDTKVERELNHLLDSHGLYLEQGYAWSFSVYYQ